MTKAFVSLAVATAFSVFWSVSIGAAVQQSGTHVSNDKIDRLLHEVRKLRDARCKSDTNAQLVCDSASMRTIWTFTRPGHPAHPAVVQRVLSAGEGGIAITRMGFWAGNEKAFSRWFDAFAALDHKQAEEWAHSLKLGINR